MKPFIDLMTGAQRHAIRAAVIFSTDGKHKRLGRILARGVPNTWDGGYNEHVGVLLGVNGTSIDLSDTYKAHSYNRCAAFQEYVNLFGVTALDFDESLVTGSLAQWSDIRYLKTADGTLCRVEWAL